MAGSAFEGAACPDGTIRRQWPSSAHPPFKAAGPVDLQLHVNDLPQMAYEARRREPFVAIDRADHGFFEKRHSPCP